MTAPLRPGQAISSAPGPPAEPQSTSRAPGPACLGAHPTEPQSAPINRWAASLPTHTGDRFQLPTPCPGDSWWLCPHGQALPRACSPGLCHTGEHRGPGDNVLLCSPAGAALALREGSGGSVPWAQPGAGQISPSLARPCPVPASTHGNAQWPRRAGRRAPLELLLPFKGKPELLKQSSLRCVTDGNPAGGCMEGPAAPGPFPEMEGTEPGCHRAAATQLTHVTVGDFC